MGLIPFESSSCLLVLPAKELFFIVSLSPSFPHKICAQVLRRGVFSNRLLQRLAGETSNKTLNCNRTLNSVEKKRNFIF
jgi:hypothetical protein